ncbi:MAG TPA: L-histidine N(alpha)-methyltransferase, partial [Patescibacteria group bacterium]|nr:L-histidine N(alpha)-methyltransferase [Patescibacteria group bacterium]
KINHKFHYDSHKQTQKWLALHQAYSPARTDPDCAGVYEAGFTSAIAKLPPGPVHLIGLGCGGGQKDTTLLRLLRKAGRNVIYTPCDVSTAMVLVARQSALSEISPNHCFPLVCDLATADDLKTALSASDPNSAQPQPVRLFTFFGMMPNFEPEIILPKLSGLICPEDILLLSANLAPGADYGNGVQRVLPLYDNELTRDWLSTFLIDLGIEKTDGQVRFKVEDKPGIILLKRIAADFQFVRARILRLESEQFEFGPGDTIRLFFSYRHTPELVPALLSQYGLSVHQRWITASSEEGVFLAGQKGTTESGSPR